MENPSVRLMPFNLVFPVSKLPYIACTVNRVAGVLLILVGVLMFTGWFERMAAWLQPYTPEFLLNRL